MKDWRKQQLRATAVVTGVLMAAIGSVMHYSFWVEDGRPDVTVGYLISIVVQLLLAWGFLYAMASKSYD